MNTAKWLRFIEHLKRFLSTQIIKLSNIAHIANCFHIPPMAQPGGGG